MGSKQRSAIHTFDIDNYLNRFIPRPRFYLLPKQISYWFGYRAPPKNQSSLPAPPVAPSVLLVWFFTFIGAFSGITIIENVFLHLPLIHHEHVPVFASFGAAAILEYNAIESPLSQPRNLLLGHLFSAAIGVGITKLFLLLPPEQFADLQWLAGALAVALSGTVMSMTKTVHPPAGATALLAVTNQQVMNLGWWTLALVLLAGSLMLASAMIVNNLYKRFPLYWWTPVNLRKPAKSEVVKRSDPEKAEGTSRLSIDSSSDAGLKQNALPLPDAPAVSGTLSTRHGSDTASTATEEEIGSSRTKSEAEVRIDCDKIIVPDWLKLSDWETEVLEGFQRRLRDVA